MSSISVNTITDASGGSTTSINGLTPTVSNMAGRNRIINGDMRINQRNTAATADGQYSVDRWTLVKGNDATESASQNSDAPVGFVNSLRNTVSVGDASIGSTQYSGFEQHIEGFNIADLGFGTANAKPVTLSFWVRSSVTGQYTGNIRNSDASRTCPFNYTISSANTWEQKTITIAGDTTGTWNTTNSRGITIALYAALGSGYSGGTAGVWGASPNFGSGNPVNGVASNGNIFAITGVQLEAGSVATPFEHRQYGQELALCQRYCVVYGDSSATRHLGIGSMYTSTALNLTLHTPATMRAQPSLTKVLNGSGQWLQTYIGGSGTNSNAGLELGEGGSTNNFRLYCVSAHSGSGSTTGDAAWVQTTAGAYLILSAEL